MEQAIESERGNVIVKYAVEITEVLQKVVEVEAESDSEAEASVLHRYRIGDIVLDSSDHMDTNIKCVNLMSMGHGRLKKFNALKSDK